MTAPAPTDRPISALVTPAARPSSPLVQARDLQVRYSEDSPLVLNGVNLDLYPGETVALLGSSGSGKSTLMKSINGFAPISGGRITAGKYDVATLNKRQLRELRAEIGQIFQQFNLIGRLNVLTNVLLGTSHNAGPLNLLGTWRASDRQRAYDLLDRVGIAEKALDRARDLSGGQQQRVAIARALMQNPKFIQADEPVASLDPRMSDTVLTLLQSIAREEGIPVLISLHSLPLALNHSDRIVGLRGGEIVVEGHTAGLTADDLDLIYDNDSDQAEGQR